MRTENERSNDDTKVDGIDFFSGRIVNMPFRLHIARHRREFVEFWVCVEINLFIASTCQAGRTEGMHNAFLSSIQSANPESFRSVSFLWHPSRHPQSMKCYNFMAKTILRRIHGAFWRQWRHSFFDYFISWISNLISTFPERHLCLGALAIVTFDFAVVMIYLLFLRVWKKTHFYRAHVARSTHKIAFEAIEFLWLTMKGFCMNREACFFRLFFFVSFYGVTIGWPSWSK